MKKSTGPNSIIQNVYLEDALSNKVTGDVLTQGDVITTDASAAAVLVGKGNLLRIRVTATTYIAFSDSASLGAVSSSTTPALELFTAGVYLVNAPFNYIRSSAALARLERIQAV